MFGREKDDEEVQSVGESLITTASLVLHRLKTKVGYTERNRHIDLNAAVFLGELLRHGGTFCWLDGPNHGNKFDNIWEAMAAAMQEFAEKDWRGKHDHVEEYSIKFSGGFPKARAALLDMTGKNIYYSPKYRVITLHGDYLMPNGKTASDEQYNQDARRAEGQLSAALNRAAASGREMAPHELLNEVVNKVNERFPMRQMSLFSSNSDKEE